MPVSCMLHKQDSKSFIYSKQEYANGGMVFFLCETAVM